MNPLELACVSGHTEILRYFVDTLNLVKKSEFKPDHENLALEDMHFVFVPIIQKFSGIMKILLDIGNMWSL